MTFATPALHLSVLPLIIGALAPHTVAGHEVLHVACAQGRSFDVRVDGDSARVQLADRELLLIRKTSSLGQYFRDDHATLIIDGSFVALVQKDQLGWRDCHVAP